MVIGYWGAWCVRRRGKRGEGPAGNRESTQQHMEQPQGVIYEEPGPGLVDTAIPLTDNQAYGHINTQRTYIVMRVNVLFFE